MTYRALDSITPANLPAGADAYIGYVDGNWQTYPVLRAMFPAAHVLGLAVFPQDDAEGCDCETGDLTPGQVPDWTRRQLGRGVHRPVVYAAASAMGDVLDRLTAAGIKRSQVRLLSAHYGLRDGKRWKHICGPATCGLTPVPMDGTQWTDKTRGLRGSSIDESLLADDFFTTTGGRPPRRSTLLEDENVIILPPGKTPEGNGIPLALPTGAKAVRFFTNGHAKIRVDRRAPGKTEELDLDYDSAHNLDVPAKVHAFVVHRLDDSEFAVGVAVSG